MNVKEIYSFRLTEYPTEKVSLVLFSSLSVKEEQPFKFEIDFEF